MSISVAIVGATGNVGREILNILADRKFPVSRIAALASRKSVGTEISFGDELLKVKDLETFDFKNWDVALFAIGSEATKQYATKAAKNGCTVIDNSSLFRYDLNVEYLKKQNVKIKSGIKIGELEFSYLDQNSDTLQGAVISKTAPTFENIAGNNYSVSRALYYYVKHQHIGVVPGMKEYMAEWTKHWGDEGALSDAGMIPMPKSERAKYKAAMTNLPVLTAADLKK